MKYIVRFLTYNIESGVKGFEDAKWTTLLHTRYVTGISSALADHNLQHLFPYVRFDRLHYPVDSYVNILVFFE